MPRADQIVALLRSHAERDDEQFRAVALQMAAHEARQGHARIAEAMRQMIEAAAHSRSAIEKRVATNIAQARGELANLVSVEYPSTRLDTMVLTSDFRERLDRVITEQLQSHKLTAHGLRPRRKLLLIGPPGAGKTMTAAALAGELRLPLFTILLEGVITKYMGETAAKMRTIFDAMSKTPGVFLFDEFDAIGTKRNAHNDVGEVRRILNSFLQFLENDTSTSIIVCATNHPELLDRALFRRFDDVLEYALPDATMTRRIVESRLRRFKAQTIDWDEISNKAQGLSQAELTRATEEATKDAILSNRPIGTPDLLRALSERQSASRQH